MYEVVNFIHVALVKFRAVKYADTRLHNNKIRNLGVGLLNIQTFKINDKLCYCKHVIDLTLSHLKCE